VAVDQQAGATPPEVPRPPRSTLGVRAEALREWGLGRVEWAQERIPGADILFATLERDRGMGGILLAGGLAYRFFFWLVPAGLVTAALLGFWADRNPGTIEDAAREAGIGAVAAQAASQAIEQQGHSRWWFLLVGSMLLFYFSVRSMAALNLAHALAWRVPIPPLRRPLLAGAAFTGVAAALAAASFVLSLLRDALPLTILPTLLVGAALYAGAVFWMSNVLPHGDAPWPALLPGALAATLGNSGVHVAVVFYLAPKLERAATLYGVLGSATVVLLWLFFFARLITFSALLNAVLWERFGDRFQALVASR
jgi:uncharacterized BrkB/YihY/UPF0761 family membrane protein